MKKVSVIVLFLLAMVFLSGCDSNTTDTRKLYLFDTDVTIEIYTNSKKDTNGILDEVEAIYNKYHKLTDNFNEHVGVNNVFTINNANGQAVEVDSELLELLKLSDEYYSKTDKLYNPYMGALTSLWRDFINKETDSLPSDEQIETAMSTYIDVDKPLTITENKVMLANADMKIDLGAVAKGYATQKVVEYLESEDVDMYLLNAGRSISLGKHPKGRDWIVGIEDPIGEKQYYETVEVVDKAIVTSGDYQRYREHNGKKYHHIINPKTGQPANYYHSATVIADDSGVSDILSTALFCMPLSEALAFVEKQADVEAIFYDIEKSVHYTSGAKGETANE